MSDVISDINSTYNKIKNHNSNPQVFDPRLLDDLENKQLWTSESVQLAISGLKEGYKLKDSPFNKNIKDAQLRKGNIAFQYSPEELEIIQLCMDNKVLFGNNFVQLKDGDKGWQNITLREYQEKLLDCYTKNRWNILMFPRQSGKTTTTIVEIVHTATFNWDKDIIVIAQSELVVNEILSKIKNAFEGLPYFMQPGFISFTKKGFVLDNGCRLSIGVASESVVQGFSIDFLFIDEFAYIPASKVNKFWINIYPALVNNPNSRCIIASTPNGRNKFWELWNGAVNKTNKFVASRIHWWEVPRQVLDGETPEQALERFKNDTILNVGLEGWLMGFECSFDTQLNSIFHTKVQQKLRKWQTEFESDWSVENHAIGPKFNIEFFNRNKFNYNLYEDFFIFGLDIAEGLGQDSSIIKIRKMYWDMDSKCIKYKLIGVYRDNEIPVEQFATKLIDLVKFFDKSKIRVVVENNQYGGEFFNQIDNLYRYDDKYADFDNVVFSKFERASKNDWERGIRWDKENKKTAVANYRSLITDGHFDDSHNLSIEESLNFARTKTGTYCAQFGHDDLTMADITLSYMIKSNNLFARAFLLEAENRLREVCNDLPEEIIKQKAEEKRKLESVYNRGDGWTQRDHKKELNKRLNRRRGGNSHGHYLM